MHDMFKIQYLSFVLRQRTKFAQSLDKILLTENENKMEFLNENFVLSVIFTQSPF